MTITKIADGYAVSPQISHEEVERIAAAGFRSLVCNRPDSEDGAVPRAMIRQIAEARGLRFHYIPVEGNVSRDHVDQMARVLRRAPRPVLAYCRSGSRATELFDTTRKVA